MSTDNDFSIFRKVAGEKITELMNRAERAEAECLEQARLLGMSASREASLLGKISQLERQLEKNNS